MRGSRRSRRRARPALSSTQASPQPGRRPPSRPGDGAPAGSRAADEDKMSSAGGCPFHCGVHTLHGRLEPGRVGGIAGLGASVQDVPVGVVAPSAMCRAPPASRGSPSRSGGHQVMQTDPAGRAVRGGAGLPLPDPAAIRRSGRPRAGRVSLRSPGRDFALPSSLSASPTAVSARLARASTAPTPPTLRPWRRRRRPEASRPDPGVRRSGGPGPVPPRGADRTPGSPGSRTRLREPVPAGSMVGNIGRARLCVDPDPAVRTTLSSTRSRARRRSTRPHPPEPRRWSAASARSDAASSGHTIRQTCRQVIGLGTSRHIDAHPSRYRNFRNLHHGQISIGVDATRSAGSKKRHDRAKKTDRPTTGRSGTPRPEAGAASQQDRLR